jgi:hypothetical protein
MVSRPKDVHWTLSTDWSTNYVYNVYLKSSDKEQGERKYYNLPTKVVHVILITCLDQLGISISTEAIHGPWWKTHAHLRS